MKSASALYPLLIVGLVGVVVWIAMMPREVVWQKHELAASGCVVEMPGIGRQRDEEIVAVRGQKTPAKGLDLVRRDLPARFFVLEYAIDKAAKGPEHILDEITLSVLSQMEGEKPAGKKVELGQHSGRSLDFLFKDADGPQRHQARIYHIRGRYVYLGVTSPVEVAERDDFREDVRRFFSSLQVVGNEVP